MSDEAHQLAAWNLTYMKKTYILRDLHFSVELGVV